MFRLRKIDSEKGFVLPTLMITTLMIMLIIIAVSSATILSYNLSSNETYKINAQFASDAGLDKALVELTSNSAYTGTPGEVELLNTGRLRTTYQIAISPGSSDDRKIIRAVGRTYGNPVSKLRNIRRYELDAQGITSGTGLTSVVSGVGGLVLNSNAKISGGDVIVNGSITINNNAQIGLQTNPVNVRVAHTSCPNPATATYPRVCGSGENGQPITIGLNGMIYGSVHATNQTNGTNMFNPGLIANQTVAPTILPDYNRNAQKSAVTHTYASTDPMVACGNNETKVWPANLRINGNLVLGNNCNITINGNVWISGNVSFGNNTVLTVSNTLGTTRPTIMVDGANGINLGTDGRIVPNLNGTGVYIITYWSNSGCSPDCDTVTGPALANSQNTMTINFGNGSSAPNSILYARWSRSFVSNNGAIGAVAGQSVELGNNATISFTSSIPGSTTIYTTWVKRGYMRVYQ